MAQTNIINRMREGLQARLRSFVLGEAVVQNWERSWGHEPVYTPEEFGDYIIKSNTVYTCATLRAQMLAGLPLKLYKNQTNGKAMEIESGPVYDLFQKVNPHWTWNRMIQQTELSLCLWGKNNWFLERGEKANLPPQEIWWAKPSRVIVVPHPVDYIEKFVYQPLIGVTPLAYTPQEVVWFRYPNPLDEFDGLSPIAASRLSADTSVMAMKSNYGIFKNGLSMGGLIVPKTGATPFTPDQAQLLEKQLESRFKGEDKAHRWGVLRMEAQIMSAAGITPKEAEFTGLLSMTLEEICRAFKVPLDLIGGQRTYANVESSRALLWEECLIPEAQFIENEIKEQLLPMFGDDSVYVKFDLDQVPVLQEAKGKEWARDRERIQTNVITINEWRKKQDMEAFAWGDEPYDKIVAEWRSMGGMFGGGSDEAGTGSDQPAIDAPADTPTTEAPTTEPPPPPRKAKRAVAGPAYGSIEHRAMLARFDQRVAAKEKALGKVVAEMLRRQQDSVMASLQGRAARSADSVAENPFSKPEWVKKFREAVRPAIRDIVNAAGDSGLEDIGVKVDFKMLDPNVVRFIETRAQRFSTQVNDTTWNKLRDSLSQGIQAGEGVDKLAARVNDTMTLRIGQSAEVIARTEVVGAENGGMLLSWRQSDIVSGKTWLATMTDGRTRETHVEAHGQTVALDEDFEVGDGAGPAPGQIDQASESVNCRCTMMAVVK